MLNLLLPLLTSSAFAGAGADFIPGVEGQWGYGAPVPSPDGRKVALTAWNRVGLDVLDLETGERTEVTGARGAGFAPLWVGDTLVFKAISTDPDAPQGAWRWDSRGLTRLDAGGRIGQPARAGSALVWTHGSAVIAADAAGLHVRRGVGDVDLLAPNPVTGALAWADGNGALHLRDADGVETDLQASPAFRPAWSDDGALLLTQSYTGRVQVVDPARGTVIDTEGTHPRWVPGTHTVVFDRVETAADVGPEAGESPYTVLDSTLWSLDADTGTVRLRFDSASLHPRFPAALPDGDLLFVDSTLGGLWRLHDGEAEPVADPPTETEGPPAPPPAFGTNAVSVPYMHQLWDTPDSFDGGWSCGPTSCVQTLAKWSVLPSADITASWPYAHTSHWGWYIPNNYSFNGYNYDVWGVAKSQDCQGAHGFICRQYGGAIWADITLYLNQHGVGSGQMGTSYDGMVGEVNAGYPVLASVSVLGYGHILVVRGYLTYDGSPIHTIVVNDPYGNAGTGDWGNFDGEGIAYDWPGYDNGYLEIGLSQLFSAHGTAPAVEPPPPEDTQPDPPPAEDTQPAEPAPVEPVDTGFGPAPYGRSHPTPPPGSLTALDDVGACSSSPAAASPWAWALVLAAGAAARRRAR